MMDRYRYQDGPRSYAWLHLVWVFVVSGLATWIILENGEVVALHSRIDVWAREVNELKFRAGIAPAAVKECNCEHEAEEFSDLKSEVDKLTISRDAILSELWTLRDVIQKCSKPEPIPTPAPVEALPKPQSRVVTPACPQMRRRGR